MGNDTNEDDVSGWPFLPAAATSGGFRGKEIVLICARSKTGKSVYDTNAALLYTSPGQHEGEINLRILKKRDATSDKDFRCVYDPDDTSVK